MYRIDGAVIISVHTYKYSIAFRQLSHHSAQTTELLHENISFLLRLASIESHSSVFTFMNSMILNVSVFYRKTSTHQHHRYSIRSRTSSTRILHLKNTRWPERNESIIDRYNNVLIKIYWKLFRISNSINCRRKYFGEKINTLSKKLGPFYPQRLV